MIIGVDGNEANVKNKVGTGQYTYSLLSQWQEKASVNNQFRIYLNSPARPEMPAENKYFRYSIFGPAKFWTQFALPIKLLFEKNKPDVFFSPAHYAPRFCPIKSVVTVHDLAYLTHPQDFRQKDFQQLKNWTKYSVNQADKVIAVSENTKKDLKKFYRLPAEKISVVYNGYDRNRFHLNLSAGETKKVQKKYHLPEKYLAFLGTLQPRKNIKSLIKAMPAVSQKFPETKLVIIGKKGWLYSDIFSLIENLNLKKSVVFTGFAPDEDVPYLLQGAQLFILPSLYEGFGITVAEAMACGTPVLVSKVSSLPEVAGQAGLFIENPQDEKEIGRKINKILGDKNLAEKLSQRGLRQAEKFSWKKCAQETLNVIKTASV